MFESLALKGGWYSYNYHGSVSAKCTYSLTLWVRTRNIPHIGRGPQTNKFAHKKYVFDTNFRLV